MNDWHLDPPEEPEPSDLDLKRQAAGKRILRSYGAETWGDVYRAIYKGTNCGATLGVSFHSHDRAVYCGDLAKYGSDAWPVEVHVSSIVEGTDATTGTHIVDLDAPLRAVTLLHAAVEAVESEAGAIWNETHGCSLCAEHHGVDLDDEQSPVWSECPNCCGDGVVI